MKLKGQEIVFSFWQFMFIGFTAIAPVYTKDDPDPVSE